MPKLKSNPEYIEVCIELEPYLIKYASAGNPGNFLYLKKRDETEPLWDQVVDKLGIPPKSWRPVRMKSHRKLSLRIPYWYIKDKGLGTWISDERKKFIAELIEVTFWKELYETVMFQKLEEGEKELVAIRNFREEFSISEDDYKEESMYKRYRRCKEKRLKRRKIREESEI